MTEVVIVSGSRTAIGTFGGGLKTVPSVRLGAAVIQDALTKAGLGVATKFMIAPFSR